MWNKSQPANYSSLFVFLLRSLPHLVFCIFTHFSLVLISHSRAGQLGVLSVTNTAEVLFTKVTKRAMVHPVFVPDRSVKGEKGKKVFSRVCY